MHRFFRLWLLTLKITNNATSLKQLRAWVRIELPSRTHPLTPAATGIPRRWDVLNVPTQPSHPHPHKRDIYFPCTQTPPPHRFFFYYYYFRVWLFCARCNPTKVRICPPHPPHTPTSVFRSARQVSCSDRPRGPGWTAWTARTPPNAPGIPTSAATSRVLLHPVNLFAPIPTPLLHITTCREARAISSTFRLGFGFCLRKSLPLFVLPVPSGFFRVDLPWGSGSGHLARCCRLPAAYASCFAPGLILLRASPLIRPWLSRSGVSLSAERPSLWDLRRDVRHRGFDLSTSRRGDGVLRLPPCPGNFVDRKTTRGSRPRRTWSVSRGCRTSEVNEWIWMRTFRKKKSKQN